MIYLNIGEFVAQNAPCEEPYPGGAARSSPPSPQERKPQDSPGGRFTDTS